MIKKNTQDDYKNILSSGYKKKKTQKRNFNQRLKAIIPTPDDFFRAERKISSVILQEYYDNIHILQDGV